MYIDIFSSLLVFLPSKGGERKIGFFLCPFFLGRRNNAQVVVQVGLGRWGTELFGLELIFTFFLFAEKKNKLRVEVE